jgi:hypothetical protein
MNNLLLVMLLGMLLFTSACERKEERILPKVDSIEQVDATEQSRLEREAFLKSARIEIDAIKIKMDELRKNAVIATGKAKDKLDQQILALEQEQKLVDQKLAEIESAIGETWKELKSGVTEEIEKFKQFLQK